MLLPWVVCFSCRKFFFFCIKFFVCKVLFLLRRFFFLKRVLFFCLANRFLFEIGFVCFFCKRFCFRFFAMDCVFVFLQSGVFILQKVLFCFALVFCFFLLKDFVFL